MLEEPERSALAAVIPEELAKLLQDEIIQGRLAPSARLTEEEVAKRYGVSRSPVREALRLLERDGLVRKAPRRGIWVAPLSVQDLDEVYSCRIALEGVAAEQAARSSDAALKGELPKVLAAMQGAHRAENVESFFLHDVQGSKVIYALAGNATLNRLISGLNKQALRYRYFAYARQAKTVRLSVQGTARIFAAIAAGRAKQAKSLTETLIGQIWDDMRPVIAGAFGPGEP
jgi:DNA-binding GntR family transcriptional regulator